jgi:hypothetical protein
VTVVELTYKKYGFFLYMEYKAYVLACFAVVYHFCNEELPQGFFASFGIYTDELYTRSCQMGNHMIEHGLPSGWELWLDQFDFTSVVNSFTTLRTSDEYSNLNAEIMEYSQKQLISPQDQKPNYVCYDFKDYAFFSTPGAHLFEKKTFENLTVEPIYRIEFEPSEKFVQPFREPFVPIIRTSRARLFEVINNDMVGTSLQNTLTGSFKESDVIVPQVDLEIEETCLYLTPCCKQSYEIFNDDDYEISQVLGNAFVCKKCGAYTFSEL